MIGIYFAILAAIFYSLNQIFNKKVTLNIEPKNGVLIVSFFLSIFSGIIAIFLGDFNHKISFYILSIILIGGILGTIGIIYLFKSFEKLKIAQTLCISNLYPFLILIYSLLIFKIIPNKMQIITMGIVFLGIYLVTKNNEKIKINKFIIYPIITAIGWSIYIFSIFLLVKEIPIYNAIFYLESMIFFITAAYLLIKNKVSININQIHKSYYSSVLSGISTTLASLFIGFATFYTNPAIVSSIVSTQIIIISILGYLIFKEKLSKIQTIGILITFLGIILFKLF